MKPPSRVPARCPRPMFVTCRVGASTRTCGRPLRARRTPPTGRTPRRRQPPSHASPRIRSSSTPRSSRPRSRGTSLHRRLLRRRRAPSGRRHRRPWCRPRHAARRCPRSRSLWPTRGRLRTTWTRSPFPASPRRESGSPRPSSFWAVPVSPSGRRPAGRPIPRPPRPGRAKAGRGPAPCHPAPAAGDDGCGPAPSAAAPGDRRRGRCAAAHTAAHASSRDSATQPSCRLARPRRRHPQGWLYRGAPAWPSGQGRGADNCPGRAVLKALYTDPIPWSGSGP